MTEKTNKSTLKVLWTVSAILLVVATLSAYIYGEKRIDSANTRRQESLLQMEHLRQTSNDLTNMARSYVFTKEPRYKQYHQLILDMRDGLMKSPKEENYVNWDFVISQNNPVHIEKGQGISWLDSIRQAGFTAEEISRLYKINTEIDNLTKLERNAMQASELVTIHDVESKKTLYDVDYLSYKGQLMQLIEEVYHQVDQRTLSELHQSIYLAEVFRQILIAALLWLFLVRWHALVLSQFITVG